MSLLTVTSLLGSALVVTALVNAGRDPEVHTVFSTQCNPYFDWQSIVLTYSFIRAGQPGKLTRLMSCSDDDYARLLRERPRVLDIVDTFVVEDVESDTELQDIYSAYNKPYSLARWLEKKSPTADVLLIVDADMMLRGPVLPSELGVEPGRPVGAYYGYLKGVANSLADTIIPEVPRMQDADGGVVGRRADQVGSFYLIYKDDFAAMAEDYYEYTRRVRFDPDAWSTSGDVYTAEQGSGRPWISEMYGYAFAAAVHGLRHRVSKTDQLYPGYVPEVPPRLLHYGIFWEVGSTGFQWDKHWFRDFDPLACPSDDLVPWSGPFGPGDVPKAGLFPTPPHPDTLTSKGRQLLTDLLAVEPLVIADSALCWWHRRTCKDLPESVVEMCDAASEREKALERRLLSLGDAAKIPGTHQCEDENTQCAGWAASGECQRNPDFMLESCKKSCAACGPPVGSSSATGTHDSGTSDGRAAPSGISHEEAYDASVIALDGAGRDADGRRSGGASMGGGGSAGGGVKGRGVPLDMNDGRDAGPGSPFLAKMERLLAWALSVSVAAYLGYKYGFMEGARRGRNAAGRLGVGGEGARSGEGLERGPINGWDWGDSAGEGFGKGLEAGKAV